MYKEIIAILPEQVKGKGIYSRIYREDKTILDDRHPALYLKNYQSYRNIPYAIDSNHVFFAFKIRNTAFPENNRAFINVKHIKEIRETTLILDSGEEIETLNQNKSLIYNRTLAKALLMEEILNKTLENERSVAYMTAYLRS